MSIVSLVPYVSYVSYGALEPIASLHRFRRQTFVDIRDHDAFAGAFLQRLEQRCHRRITRCADERCKQSPPLGDDAMAGTTPPRYAQYAHLVQGGFLRKTALSGATMPAAPVLSVSLGPTRIGRGGCSHSAITCCTARSRK